MKFTDWLSLSVTGKNAQWTSGRHTAADTLPGTGWCHSINSFSCQQQVFLNARMGVTWR